MRSDDLYLVDILEAARSLARSLGGKDLTAFSADEDLQAVANWNLLKMGEAANQMSIVTQQRLGEAAVRRIRRFCNRLAHGYFNVEVARVFAIATESAPDLRIRAEAELKRSFPAVYAELRRRNTTAAE